MTKEEALEALAFVKWNGIHIDYRCPEKDRQYELLKSFINSHFEKVEMVEAAGIEFYNAMIKAVTDFNEATEDL